MVVMGTPTEPFWPRRSPHFLKCRRAVRAVSAVREARAAHSCAAGPVVIGVSGGADSLALAAAAAAEGVNARAVVVDHQLQEGSAAVAQRAADQVRSFGLAAEVVAVEVPEGNVEAAAREARYAALFAAADRYQGADVWVAHTADDQAETFLLGALRGNPAGMAPRAGRLVRPLLGVRRADTAGACEELAIEPWHDPMNSDPAFRRVAVRTQIIPALSELLGGDAVPALAAAADRIAADEAFIAAQAQLAPTTDCAELLRDEAVVRSRRLASWLHDNNVPVQGDQLAAIDALVTNWHGQGPVDVAGGRAVVREGGQLRLR